MLSVADLDAYIAARGTSMRRTSKVTMISTLRGVLRYLYGRGLMPVDLAGAIEGPPIYALEGIPSTIRREDIERALEAARRDHSPLGRRDYAILMLLSTYGLRAGEIARLCLSDIDWRVTSGFASGTSRLVLARSFRCCVDRPTPCSTT